MDGLPAGNDAADRQAIDARNTRSTCIACCTLAVAITLESLERPPDDLALRHLRRPLTLVTKEAIGTRPVAADSPHELAMQCRSRSEKLAPATTHTPTPQRDRNEGQREAEQNHDKDHGVGLHVVNLLTHRARGKRRSPSLLGPTPAAR